jgi:hypothetical protein
MVPAVSKVNLSDLEAWEERIIIQQPVNYICDQTINYGL